MTDVLDIFSKPKIKEKPKLIINPKILADYREKNSMVPSELMHLGIEVEFKHLKVADYLVGEVAIERKTISDFISSMINKRLIRQLEELQQYQYKLLIIEGLEEQELYNDKSEIEQGVNANAIRGFLLTILLRFKVPIIFSKNEEDTARFINLIAKKKRQEPSLNVKKKSLNKKEQLQYLIEGFPGIGPKTAQKLLKEFKTIRSIINAPLEKVHKLIGKKSHIFKLIDEEY